MPVNLTFDVPITLSPEVFLARVERLAAEKGVPLQRAGATRLAFEYRKLWVTLLKGTCDIEPGMAQVRLTEVPPFMSEADLRAKVEEKVTRLDSGYYEDRTGHVR